ncbi:coiled-coil domain-containing protein 169-like [Haliotis asinina]|uniref:coiled-coil domain-containing protein 169-like n=1 Tax=Haliotis asinina TaxID=109174 RepID=UPI003531BEF7
MEEEDEEDDIRAIQRLRRELYYERETVRTLHASANQWRNIVRENLAMNIQREQEEVEWRIRYQYQRSFNEMLKKLIENLRTEIRELRRGNTEASSYMVGDMLKRSLPECRLKVRHFETDLKSMKNLRNMYERQLDHESVEYSKVKEKRTAVFKDLLFMQNICIKQQQTFEKEYFAKLRERHGGILFRDSTVCLRRGRQEGVKARVSNVRTKDATIYSGKDSMKRSDTLVNGIVARASSTSLDNVEMKDTSCIREQAALEQVTRHIGRTHEDKTSEQFQGSKHGKKHLERVTYNDDIFNF